MLSTHRKNRAANDGLFWCMSAKLSSAFCALTWPESCSILGHMSQTLEKLDVPSLGQALEDVERRHIIDALRQTRGNKRQAAAILQISRGTLYRRLTQYGLADHLVRKPQDGLDRLPSL